MVDENHIVQSWSLPSEDEVPDSTGQIGSAVSDATDLTKQKAPRVPPMFLLPPPFTYVGLFCTMVVLWDWADEVVVGRACAGGGSDMASRLVSPVDIARQKGQADEVVSSWRVCTLISRTSLILPTRPTTQSFAEKGC